MTWAAVSWAYKDVITSAKLAQMIENVRVHDHRSDGSQGASFGMSNYTPAWTAVTTNPNIGNGAIGGRWVKIGQLVVIFLNVDMGTTTTFGSGSWRFSVPAAVTLDTTVIGATADPPIGGAFRGRIGANHYGGNAAPITGSTFAIQGYPASVTASQWDSATPAAWVAAGTSLIRGVAILATT